MENGDDWLAYDKLQHFLLCFSLTLIFSFLASRTRYSFLRRRSISLGLGCILSLSVGAAKEVADELGFFKSAGASAKDAVADILGVFLALLALTLCSFDRSVELSLHPNHNSKAASLFPADQKRSFSPGPGPGLQMA